MTYLIDTNIISEVRKGERCDANVRAWYASIDDTSLYLSVLVLGEVRKGIELARGKDPARGRALEQWLAAVRQAFAGRILPVDDAVGEEWGRMSAKRPVSVIDGLLAATAKVHCMTLVTRNKAGVADLGARVIDPFGPVARRR
ncbi:MAG: type II toxin-antitoxin system VapC family toxin [Alphaproteobacteria bacterium]|nr:type II toxin-antitoxin system VapC family toxin [Alphaproteobacteria bacterium]